MVIQHGKFGGLFRRIGRAASPDGRRVRQSHRMASEFGLSRERVTRLVTSGFTRTFHVVVTGFHRTSGIDRTRSQPPSTPNQIDVGLKRQGRIYQLCRKFGRQDTDNGIGTHPSGRGELRVLPSRPSVTRADGDAPDDLMDDQAHK